MDVMVSKIKNKDWDIDLPLIDSSDNILKTHKYLIFTKLDN